MSNKKGFGITQVLIIIGVVLALVIGIKVLVRLSAKSSMNNTTNPPSAAKTYSGVFDAINKIRADKGLPTLAIDDKLCAYARRRALQYQEKGDAAASIFQTDGNDKNIMNTYFTGFGNIVETYIKAPLLTDVEVAQKFSDESNKGAIKMALTNGCVSDAPTTDGTGDWVVFIGSTKSPTN